MLLLSTEEAEWREDYGKDWQLAAAVEIVSRSKLIKHFGPGSVLLSRDAKSTKSWFLPLWTVLFSERDRRVSSLGPFSVLHILINTVAEINFFCTAVWITFLVIYFLSG